MSKPGQIAACRPEGVENEIPPLTENEQDLLTAGKGDPVYSKGG